MRPVMLSSNHPPRPSAGAPSTRGRSRSRSRAGYTLVEIVIASVIFAFTSVSLTSLALQTRRFTEEAIYLSTALTAAQGYLEQMKNMDYNDLFEDPIPTEFNQGDPDPIIPTPTPIDADPTNWVWNEKSLELQQTPANSADNVRMWLSAHVEQNNAVSVRITVYFYYESRAFRASRASPIYSLRVIRSQVPTFS